MVRPSPPLLGSFLLPFPFVPSSFLCWCWCCRCECFTPPLISSLHPLPISSRYGSTLCSCCPTRWHYDASLLGVVASGDTHTHTHTWRHKSRMQKWSDHRVTEKKKMILGSPFGKWWEAKPHCIHISYTVVLFYYLFKRTSKKRVILSKKLEMRCRKADFISFSKRIKDPKHYNSEPSIFFQIRKKIIRWILWSYMDT